MEESFLFFATRRQVAYMHSTLTDCQCGFDVWKTGKRVASEFQSMEKGGKPKPGPFNLFCIVD